MCALNEHQQRHNPLHLKSPEISKHVGGFINQTFKDQLSVDVHHPDIVINIEVREDYAQLAAENLKLCMSKAADKWCKTIKLSADACITTYWNH